MNKQRDIVGVILQQVSDPLIALHMLGGYYECPKDDSGRRLGPLVGYAGKDGQGRQFVGEVYANFGEMEQWPLLLRYFGRALMAYTRKSAILNPLDCLCGAPLGGMAFGTVMTEILGCRYVFPEKVVTAVATTAGREESELKFARHKIVPGESIGIVDDVVNNFSTTEKLIRLIMDAGASVGALICLLNRSLTIDSVYHSQVADCDIPVISVVRKPIYQWQQDDPEVAVDVSNGNVVWKPKTEWDRLMEVMEQAKT